MKCTPVTILCLVLLLLACSCSKKSAPKEQETRDDLPRIVPYLDCAPSPSDGQGKAEMRPKGPFLVGATVDFEITFTVGEAGIAPGGFVLLQISPWWGWSRPQSVNPEGAGYITVSPSFTDSSFRAEILPMHRVLVFSRQRRFRPGETITFKYSRARLDMFAEAEELFMFFVDADGDGNSACIASPPVIQTLAREPVRLNVVSPSQAVPGRPIRVSAAPLDSVGNWSTLLAGSYTLSIDRDGKVEAQKRMKARGNEKRLVFGCTPAAEGIYFFHVKGPKGLSGKSNVTLCQQGVPRLKLYFGDIHGHSRLSDGTGTPEDFYCYARDVSGLDIAALTDHADYGMTAIKGAAWQRIKDAANRMYVPGRFVTFLGFEWTSWTYGHRNVYYRDGEGPVFRSLDRDSDTPQELWQRISPFEAMSAAHHVGGGPVAVDWTIPPGPGERLVEICSVHGSSEYYGCEAGIYNPRPGHFVRDALALGYRLGIFASGDSHDGHPGQRSVNARTGGLLAVYASALTREAVWEAFLQRRVYGTSGARIILNFRVCDAPMGSEVNWPQSKKIPIAFRTVCCADIERIEIIRSGVPIFAKGGEGVFDIFLAEDPQPLTGTSWYYARVIQKDGHMAWSSPIWVTIK